MTSDAHKKHAEVTQLKGGKFHHNEFAFMGGSLWTDSDSM